MRCIAFLIGMVLAARVVVAADSPGASMLAFDNGDLHLQNVWPSHAAPESVVDLSKEGNYYVACQVFYHDPEKLRLQTREDFVDRQRMDQFFNEMLQDYMTDCWELSDEDLVSAYRSRVVARYLEGFPRYVSELAQNVEAELENCQDSEEALYLSDLLNLAEEAGKCVVTGVSMTAMGALAEAVDAR